MQFQSILSNFFIASCLFYFAVLSFYSMQLELKNKSACVPYYFSGKMEGFSLPEQALMSR